MKDSGVGVPLSEAQCPPEEICELTGGGRRAQRGLSPGSPLLSTRPPRMLRNNRISCIHNDSFTGLRNVRLLSLYDNQIATISPGAFDTLQALSTL